MARQPDVPPMTPEEEAQVAERYRRVTTQRIDTGPALPIGLALCCPRCGSPQLRCLGVVVFDRSPISQNKAGLPVGHTDFVRVFDGVVANHSLPIQGHTNRIAADNRRGHVLEFGCRQCVSIYEEGKLEGLGHGIVLEIIDYEDSATVLRWTYDPMPEEVTVERIEDGRSHEDPA